MKWAFPPLLPIVLLLLGAPASAIPAAPAAPEAHWHTFRSESGGFSIQMPASPVLGDDVRTTFVGEIRDSNYTARWNGARFRVEHHDIPRLGRMLMSDASILSRAMASVLEELGGHERSRSEFEAHGFPGRLLRFEIEEDGTRSGTAAFVLTGRRLYIVSVTCRDDVWLDDDPFDAFFASFDFWPKED